MPTFSELIDHDRRAVLATAHVAARITPDDYARPTPCEGWTVADLLAHMTGQQIGFAAAARGNGADRSVWEWSTTPYVDACAEVIAAFNTVGVADRSFVLPEIRDGGGFPAAMAVGFHLLDNVVHAWDLAVSIGVAPVFDAGLIAAVLELAADVPDGPARLQPGAAFAPVRPVEAGRSPLDRILLLLGRDPEWTPEPVSPRIS
jgi:uncharacterized protein (TIGR03086 family)